MMVIALFHRAESWMDMGEMPAPCFLPTSAPTVWPEISPARRLDDTCTNTYETPYYFVCYYVNFERAFFPSADHQICDALFCPTCPAAGTCNLNCDFCDTKNGTVATPAPTPAITNVTTILSEDIALTSPFVVPMNSFARFEGRAGEAGLGYVTISTAEGLAYPIRHFVVRDGARLELVRLMLTGGTAGPSRDWLTNEPFLRYAFGEVRPISSFIFAAFRCAFLRPV